MIDFKIHPEVEYAIDIKGFVVVKSRQYSMFISYPQAAVWLLLADQKECKIALRQIQAVLFDLERHPLEFVNECLVNWKEQGLII